MSNRRKQESRKRKCCGLFIFLCLKIIAYQQCSASAFATSAAPIYFKPYERGHWPKLYSDGALHANLPVAYALWETQKMWPPVDGSRPPDEVSEDYSVEKELGGSIGAIGIGEEPVDEAEDAESDLGPLGQGREVHLDALGSIGTVQQKRVDRYPNAFEIGGLKQAYLSFIKAMDTEASWREFKARPQYNRHLHHRLNVPILGKYVGIDDWNEMLRLEKAVHGHYRDFPDQANAVQDVAARLTASLLFFELDTPSASRLHPLQNFHRIQGQIWCRLPRDSAALVALTDRITGFWFKEDSPQTMMKGRFLPLPLKDDWKSEIRTQGKHLALPIRVKTMDPDATHTIAVALRDTYPYAGVSSHSPKEERRVPISGFHVVFRDLQALVSPQ